MKKFIALCPADGWYFVHETNGALNYMRVAVWATDQDGGVVGLVSVVDNGGKLTPPPSNVKGKYMLRDDLTVAQRQQADKVSDITVNNLQ